MQNSCGYIWSTTPRLCKQKKRGKQVIEYTRLESQNHHFVHCNLEKIAELLSNWLLLSAGHWHTHTTQHSFLQNPNASATPPLPACIHTSDKAFWGGRWQKRRQAKEHILSTQNKKGSNKNWITHVYIQSEDLEQQVEQQQQTWIFHQLVLILGLRIRASFSTKETKRGILLASTAVSMPSYHACHHACLFEDTPLEGSLSAIYASRPTKCKL